MIRTYDRTVTTEAPTTDWYAEACRRARAYGRRRRAAKASTVWPEFAPPVALSDGPLGEVQAADREIGRQTAVRARAVAEFAATRPATADRAQGEPGAMSAERWSARPEVLRPVSEWAGRELMIALSITEQAADALLTRSLTLMHRLPGTVAALEAGALHPGHLWTMLEKVAPIADDRIRAEVEAELLRWAVGRVVTPAQLGAKARREVLERDARAAAQNLQKALKERGIHVRPHTVDGMAALTILTTMPEAQALYRTLTALVEALDAPDDPRTRGEKMVDCLLDLVLRPGESDLPPVQVLLTMVASIGTLAGGDAPGEIDGQVVPAEMIRQFLTALLARQQPPPPGPDHDGAQDDTHLWEETLREALAAWGAETERRVLAGEPVDPGPLAEREPASRDQPPPQSRAPSDDLLDPEPPEDPPAAERTHRPAPAEPATETSPPVETPPEETPPEETPPDRAGPSRTAPPSPAPSAGSATPDQAGAAGRGAAADHAIDDASLALFRVGQKLTLAQQLVRAAAGADDADEAAWQASPAGRLTDAHDAITALLA